MDKIRSAVQKNSKTSKPGKGLPAKSGSAATAAPKNSESSATAEKAAPKHDIKGKSRERTVPSGKHANRDGAAASQEAEELDEHAILLREIKSFGGTEEDYEMLRGIDSDSEAEEKQQAGTSKSVTTGDEVCYWFHML